MFQICKDAIVIVKTPEGVKPEKTFLGFFVGEEKDLGNGVQVSTLFCAFFISDFGGQNSDWQLVSYSGWSVEKREHRVGHDWTVSGVSVQFFSVVSCKYL